MNLLDNQLNLLIYKTYLYNKIEIITNRIMLQLLDKIESLQNWKDILRNACKRNHLSTNLSGNLTILKAKLIYQRFSKNYQNEKQRTFNYWMQNQLKAYCWILIVLSALQNLLIVQFVTLIQSKNQKHWNLLQQIFQFKSLTFLRYESQRFLNDKKKNKRAWKKQQEEFLMEIILQKKQEGLNPEEHRSFKWNQIARFLYDRSGQTFFRTPKHCRQRWFNHLDPAKKQYFPILLSGVWTFEQDELILKLVDEKGKKWSMISEKLGWSRTEHMVKNRYNSLLYKQKKINPKIKRQSKIIQHVLENLRHFHQDKKPQPENCVKKSIQPSSVNSMIFKQQKKITQHHEIKPSQPEDFENDIMRKRSIEKQVQFPLIPTLAILSQTYSKKSVFIKRLNSEQDSFLDQKEGQKQTKKQINPQETMLKRLNSQKSDFSIPNFQPVRSYNSINRMNSFNNSINSYNSYGRQSNGSFWSNPNMSANSDQLIFPPSSPFITPYLYGMGTPIITFQNNNFGSFPYNWNGMFNQESAIQEEHSHLQNSEKKEQQQ